MSEFSCPGCHATLDEDTLARLESPECPFCGQELPQAMLAASERFRPAEVSASPKASDTDASTIAATLPPKSRIQVVEASPDRLLLYIPAGGSRQTRGLGFFALFWNGFMAVFTSIWAVVGGKDVPWFFLVPFLGLFWLIGLVMLGFWIRMRFSRFFVLVEPTRFSLQRVLFNRKTTKTAELGPESRAELVESYRENNVPVYAVAVTGTPRTIKFGVGLTPAEKDWLVEQINRMLGRETGTSLCPECGATWSLDAADASLVETCPECGASVTPVVSRGSSVSVTPPEIRPEEVPPESPVEIQHADPQHLRFSLGLIPHPVARVAVTAAACVFALIWWGFAGWFMAQGGFPLFFGVFLAVAGIIPVVAAVLIARSKITIDGTRDWFACRWHAGPFGYTYRVLPETIEGVTLEAGDRVVRSGPRRSPRARTGQLVCVLNAGGKKVPLTLGHDKEIARLVGGLVRWHLRQLGILPRPE